MKVDFLVQSEAYESDSIFYTQILNQKNHLITSGFNTILHIYDKERRHFIISQLDEIEHAVAANVVQLC